MDRQTWHSVPQAQGTKTQPIRIWRSVAGGIGAIALMGSSVGANPVGAWQYDPATHNLEVTLKEGAQPRYFLMAQPARIVVDLPETSLGKAQQQATYTGAVRQIRAAQHDPTTTRIVLELSPDVVLAPGQVQLQKVAGAKPGNVRWTVRPLIAASAGAKVATSTGMPTTSWPSTTPVPVTPPATEARSIAEPVGVSSQKPALSALPTLPEQPTSGAMASEATRNATAKDSPPTQLPHLEPRQRSQSRPSPAEPPKQAETAVVTPKVEPVSFAVSPSPATTQPSTLAPAPQEATLAQGTDQVPEVPVMLSASVVQPQTAAATPPLNQPVAIAVPPPELRATMPQPPASAPSSVAQPPSATTPAVPASAVSTPAAATATAAAQGTPSFPDAPTPPPTTPALEVPGTQPVVAQTPPMITVPELDAAPPAASSQPPMPIVSPLDAPPASFPLPANAPPNVSVPPLESEMTTPAPAPSSTPSEVIQFGQPLPGVSAPKSFLLPKGTVLTLRFPSNTAMNLQSGMPRQEVLLLAADVRDGVGRVIFSAGTPVTGRFETSGAGSRFITQAIALAGRSIPLSAQSEPMAGGRRLSENSLLRNAGIGAVAGAVLSDFSGFGVLGGAATGAAVTYLTSPRPATIQPNQQIQVRLTEELRQY